MDVPTNTTPKKKEWCLPEKLFKTRDHAVILAELKGETVKPKQQEEQQPESPEKASPISQPMFSSPKFTQGATPKKLPEKRPLPQKSPRFFMNTGGQAPSAKRRRLAKPRTFNEFRSRNRRVEKENVPPN